MILNLIGVVLLLNVADYTVLTTMPTYITAQLHFSTTTSTLVIIGAELLQMALISPLGALSDRIGRKPLLYTAALGYIVLSYPAFWLMHTRHLAGLVAGFVILAILLVCILAVIGSTFPAMFPTRVRYGSFAIGYNLSTSIFGGTAGLVIESLITLTGNTYVPAYYLMGAGVIGLVPVMLMPETSQVPMASIEP
jgi:MHS family proline/betaine transporter-like MFS transporter